MWNSYRSVFAVLALAVAIATVPANRPVQAAVTPEVLAAAKREGVVVWYSSIDSKTLAAIVQRFERRYPGIKLQTLQLTSNLIPVRITTEQRGGKVNADVANGDIVPMSQLAAAGALQPYRPAEPAKYGTGTIDPNGLWVSLYSDTTVIAWNPKKLSADGLRPPASLADLARPEWNGKIGLNATAYNWYAGLVATDPNAQELIKKIVANHPLITQGHTNTVMQMEAGEFTVTPTAYGYLADKDHRAGLPIDFLNPKPLLVGLGPVGLTAGAPHPNAGRVLLDWLLSKDGQQAIVELSGRPSGRTDVQNNPNVLSAKMPVHVLTAPDPARYRELVAQYKALLGITE
jgi:iron(III) transport system substrate-binding protein